MAIYVRSDSKTVEPIWTAVFSFGNASEGELGLRGVEDDHVLKPTQLKCFGHSNKIRDIASGRNHTIVLLQDGTVFTCGNNDSGQLGQEKSRRRLEQVESLAAHTVQSVSSGSGYSVALNEAGQLFSWGNNSDGQLGLQSEEETMSIPRMIKHLAMFQVIQVTCGAEHTLALINNGELYSWGQNKNGQLGLGTRISEKRPQLIKSLLGIPISQIAAGGYHSFVLSHSGALFGWGKNEFGQLGLSDQEDRTLPSLQKTLRSQNIMYVCCGEDHTAVLTKEGGVFTFGAGMYGQLGHGSKSNEVLPRKVLELMGITVTQIACGRCHTLAYVPSRGRLYAFGLGGSGQLGLGSSTNNRTSPTLITGPWTDFCTAMVEVSSHNQVSDFLESDSLNGKHFNYNVRKTTRPVYSEHCDSESLLKLSKSEHFSCVEQMDEGSGHSSSSDMDVDTELNNNSNRKQLMRDSDRSAKACPVIENEDGNTHFSIYKIVCGGDHSFVITTYCKPSFESTLVPPQDFRVVTPESRIVTIDNNLIEQVKNIPAFECVPQDIMSYLETVFSSSACLNGSFLMKNDSHFNCSSENHGVDMNSAFYGFHCIEEAENSTIAELVGSCLENNIFPNLSPALDIEGARLYLHLPLCHLFHNPAQYLNPIISPFAKALLSLPEKSANVVEKWWTTLEVSHFKNLVLIFKRAVIYILTNSEQKKETELSARNEQLRPLLDILSKLNKTNIDNGEMVPYQDFYIPEVTENIDVKYDYVYWLQSNQGQQGKLFFCDYPFVFDAKAKTLILQTDSLIQMQTAMDSAYRQNLTSVFMPLVAPVNPYLVLYVTRENIVLDTIGQLSQQQSMDLKKPMKVMFYGEDAVDAGGVKKEFFLMLMKEILDPKYGMFTEYPETRCIWFNAQTFEEDTMFYLIGIVCGLAIYNFTIIDLPFPLVLYKKLLKEQIKIEDFKNLSPTVAKSLQELLQYEDDNVEEVFVLTFEISLEVYGEKLNFELKPGGKDIPVTNVNKAEYVNLYVDFILNKSVEVPFVAFARGFYKVCNSRILELFHAQELMTLVIGNEAYDWKELENSAEYKNDYNRNHPTIEMFWKVFHSLEQGDKKKFLLFLTGSDKIPILGMKSIKDYVEICVCVFNLAALHHSIRTGRTEYSGAITSALGPAGQQQQPVQFYQPSTRMW